ncbi:MAG: M1 family aminopeptidase, partial [Cyclobacteriaceae bacterium]
MSRIILTITILSLFLITSCDKSKIEEGVSQELAEQRKENLLEVTYGLHFDIPESSEADITAQNVIYILYKKTQARYLYLDFNENREKLKRIEVNKKPIDILFENGHIAIPSDLLIDGGNEIIIDFIAGDLSLNRNSDYLYTLFVPDRASSCFPSFDQPDIKASYFLELGLPLDWEGVSNTRTFQVDTVDNRKLLRFDLSKPISTYHFAFAAGKFKKAADEQSGMIMYFRETDSVKVANNLTKIFELHRQSIAWMEEYTAYQYPFLKLDFVLIPSFQYGGMEHPGNIFYRESSLLLEATPSVNQELRRASLIAHETAHMWFGNLVTMKWFNDVWLKEVFANFMASKIVNPQFPEVNHDLRFLMAHYPSAYEVDRSAGSHPVQQKLENLKNAGTLYGSIIYQKAPIMLRNLEERVGAQAFQNGVRDYLSDFNYANASWDDLLASIENHTAVHLGVWNKAWIRSSGMPEIEYNKSDNNYVVKISNDTANIYWPQKFQYQLTNGQDNQIVDVEIVDEHPPTFSLDRNMDLVLPNYKGAGYGYFKAD